MKYIILINLLCTISFSQIQLTKVPSEMLTYGKIKDGSKTSEVDIKWLSTYSGSQVYFRFSKTPGLASNTSDIVSKRVLVPTSNFGILFKPADLPSGGDFPSGGEITPGVYYCYIQDVSGASTKSVEFQLIIEADTAPINLSPTDASVSTNGILSWEDPLNDSPQYFHVMVSDSPIKLRDEDGEIKIDSARIVYQAIVPRSIVGGSIEYGIPDPSGHFANASTVPLIHDHTYYWAVLNNYGNHPALTSGITPSKIASFVYKNADTYLPTTVLTSPADNSQFDQNESIRFAWNQNSGGSPDYEINIYEIRNQDGNTFSFLVKQVVLNSSSSEFNLNDAQSSLRTNDYVWNIVSKDGQKVSVSETRKFSYVAPPSTTMRIRTLIDGSSNSLGRTTLNIFPKGSSDTELLTYYTDGGGYFYRSYLNGTYIIVAKKDGYQQSETEVDLVSTSNDTVSFNVYLNKIETFFTGSVTVPSTASNQPSIRLVKYLSSSDSTITYHNAANSETSGDNEVYHYQIYVDTTLTGETYKVSPSLANYRFPESALQVEMDEGDNTEFSFTMEQEESIVQLTLLVKDQSNSPVHNASVQITQGSNQENLVTTSTGQVITNIVGDVPFSISTSKLNYTFEDDVNLTPSDEDISLSLELLRNPLFTGVVENENGTATLENATVTISKAGFEEEYITGTTGSFQFSEGPGTYIISIKHQDYEDLNSSVQLTAGQDIQEEYNLIELRTDINGSVYFQNDLSSKIENVKISYTEVNDSLKTGETYTDANGNYTLAISSESLVIQIEKEGFLTSVENHQYIANSSTSQDFLLYENIAGLSGIISSDTNVPLESVKISAYDISGNLYRSSISNSSGEYLLILEPTITYSKISFELSDYETIDTLLNVNFNYEENVSLDTVKLNLLANPISGIISGFNNKPLENVLIVTDLSDSVYTDIFGQFSFEGKGQSSISVFSSVYNDTTFATSNNQSHNINLSYDYKTISGRILDDSSGDGIDNARITFYASDGGAYSGSVHSSSTGAYSVDLPPERVYRFTVEKARYQTSDSYDVDASISSTVTIDKSLEKVNISNISIQPLGFGFDLESHVTLRSSDSLFFNVIGIDTLTGLPVQLDGIKWSVEEAIDSSLDNLVSISDRGVISFDENLISDGLKVYVEDTIGGVVNDTIELTVLAQLGPSSTETVLKDIDGFELTLNANYISESQLVALRKRELPSALQSSLKGRVLPLTYDVFFVSTGEIAENINTSEIDIPIDVTDDGYVLVKWNDNLLDWEQVSGGEIPVSRSTASLPFTGFGQYGLMRLSLPLNLSNISVLPNPFSPLLDHLEDLEQKDIVDGDFSGSKGTNILFLLDSKNARQPILTAKIYNFRGNLIRTLINNEPRNTGVNIVQWNGKTDHGQDARNGRYMLILNVKDSSVEKTELKQIVLVK